MMMKRSALLFLVMAVMAVAAVARAQATPWVWDLRGPWSKPPQFSADLKVLSVDRTSVSMTYASNPSLNLSYCGCSRQHLHIQLDHSYSCKNASLLFDFHHERRAVVTPAGKDIRGGRPASTSLVFAFCKGGVCGTASLRGPAYVDHALLVSDEAKDSVCWTFDDARLHDGPNELPTQGRGPHVDGFCGDDFDGLDVDVQVASCDPREEGTITLANLRVVTVVVPPPAPQPPEPHAAPPEVDSSGTVAGPRAGSGRGPFEIYPSGHVAFAAGGATGSVDSGFRLALDASLGIAFSPNGKHGAWTIASSIVTGFHQYPSYASLDFGRAFFAGTGQFGGFSGGMITVGPAFRFDPSTGFGGELGLRAYLLMFQAGVRAIYIGSNGSEGQVLGTLGIGLF